jgi:predicted DNA-binding protein (MmcQ/YjbR family)
MVDTDCDAMRDGLMKLALSFPEAWEDFPWDEPVVKVRKKIFAFFGKHEDDCFRLGVKLPESGDVLLEESWAEPSSHGLGKSGWVSLKFDRSEEMPLDLLEELIVESYLAVAPKTLSKQLLAEQPAS